MLVIVCLRSVVFLRNGCLHSIHSRTTRGEANHFVDCIWWNKYHLIVVNKGNYSGIVGSWLSHVMKQWRGRDWVTHDVFAVQPWRPVNILVSGKVLLAPLKVYLKFLYIIVIYQLLLGYLNTPVYSMFFYIFCYCFGYTPILSKPLVILILDSILKHFFGRWDQSFFLKWQYMSGKLFIFSDIYYYENNSALSTFQC